MSTIIWYNDLMEMELDLGISLDLGIELDAGVDIDPDVGLDLDINISLEAAPADGSTANYAEFSNEVDYGTAETELDPGLIDTINAIGASVMAEMFPIDLALANNLPVASTPSESFPKSISTGSTLEPKAEVFDLDPDTDLEGKRDILYYDPLVWEITSPISEPESEPAAEPTTVNQPIESAQAPETTEATLTQLLQSDQTPSLSPSPDHDSDQSQEAFNALLNRRGLSMENASVTINHGLLDGEPFTDTTEYVETSTGLNLVRNTRVFEGSGQATTELAATYSMQEYLRRAHPDDVKRRPNLHVRWNEQDSKYEMEWRENGPQYFPEDVEVQLRQEFQNRWQAEDREATPQQPILVKDQQELQLPDDETIFTGVHKSLNRARPQSIQPRVTRS